MKKVPDPDSAGQKSMDPTGSSSLLVYLKGPGLRQLKKYVSEEKSMTV